MIQANRKGLKKIATARGIKFKRRDTTEHMRKVLLKSLRGEELKGDKQSKNGDE